MTARIFFELCLLFVAPVMIAFALLWLYGAI